MRRSAGRHASPKTLLWPDNEQILHIYICDFIVHQFYGRACIMAVRVSLVFFLGTQIYGAAYNNDARFGGSW